MSKFSFLGELFKNSRNATATHNTCSNLFSLPSSGISRAFVWYLQIILRQAPKKRVTPIFHNNRMTGHSWAEDDRNIAVFQKSVHLTPAQSGVSLPAQNTIEFLLSHRHQPHGRNQQPYVYGGTTTTTPTHRLKDFPMPHVSRRVTSCCCVYSDLYVFETHLWTDLHIKALYHRVPGDRNSISANCLLAHVWQLVPFITQNTRNGNLIKNK